MHNTWLSFVFPVFLSMYEKRTIGNKGATGSCPRASNGRPDENHSSPNAAQENVPFVVVEWMLQSITSLKGTATSG